MFVAIIFETSWLRIQPGKLLVLTIICSPCLFPSLLTRPIESSVCLVKSKNKIDRFLIGSEHELAAKSGIYVTIRRNEKFPCIWTIRPNCYISLINNIFILQTDIMPSVDIGVAPSLIFKDIWGHKNICMIYFLSYNKCVPDDCGSYYDLGL